MRDAVPAYTKFRGHPQGFTLVELMIVVVIIGLLASIGLANYISMRENAKFASCICNQRNIHEAAFIYAQDNNIQTTAINVNAITATGLITREVGECPSSGNKDWDDYNIQFNNGAVTQITCSIRGPDHLYTP